MFYTDIAIQPARKGLSNTTNRYITVISRQNLLYTES